MTYAWLGFVLTAIEHHRDPVGFAGNALLAAAAIVLGAAAVTRSAAAGPVSSMDPT